MKDINLLPKHHIEADKNRKIRLYTIAAVGAVTAIAVSLAMIPVGMITVKESTLAEINQQLGNSRFQEFDAIQKQMTALQAEVDKQQIVLDSISKDSIVRTDILDVLTSALPPLAYIQTVTVEDAAKSVSVGGIADTREDVIEYLINLTHIPLFTDVKLTSISLPPSKEKKTGAKQSDSNMLTGTVVPKQPPIQYSITFQYDVAAKEGEEVANEETDN